MAIDPCRSENKLGGGSSAQKFCFCVTFMARTAVTSRPLNRFIAVCNIDWFLNHFWTFSIACKLFMSDSLSKFCYVHWLMLKVCQNMYVFAIFAIGIVIADVGCNGHSL